MLENPNIARVNRKNVFIHKNWQSETQLWPCQLKLKARTSNFRSEKMFKKVMCPNNLEITWIWNILPIIRKNWVNYCTPTPAPGKVAHGYKKKKIVGERKTWNICQRAREAQCTKKRYVLVSPDGSIHLEKNNILWLSLHQQNLIVQVKLTFSSGNIFINKTF